MLMLPIVLLTFDAAIPHQTAPFANVHGVLDFATSAARSSANNNSVDIRPSALPRHWHCEPCTSVPFISEHPPIDVLAVVN